MTTSSTEFAPATNVCAEKSDSRSRSRPIAGDRTKAGERLREEVRAFHALGGALPPAEPRGELMKNVDSRNVDAVVKNTISVLAAASKTPAIAGPTKRPMLSSVLTTALAAVSSPGVLATVGMSAASAGRKGVPTIMASPAIT